MKRIENEKLFFSTYLDEENPRGAVLDAPRDRGEIIMATDCHILIKVPKSLLSERYEEATKPNIPEIEPNRNILLTLEQLEKGISKYPHIDEEEVISSAVKCSECNGEGQVIWEYEDKSYRKYYHECECPICKGCGNERDAVTRKTGRSFPEELHPIEIDGIPFNAYYIGVIIETMKQLGLSEIYHVGVYKSANLFKIANGIEIILMPILSDEIPITSVRGKTVRQ